MSNDPQSESPQQPPSAVPSDLKASDFFPPGAGWNQASEGSAATSDTNASNQDGQRLRDEDYGKPN